MTDTITKIRVLADDFADSGRTYEGCDVARALNGFADRCEATNPTPDHHEGSVEELLRELVRAIDTYGEQRLQYWPETVAAVNFLTRLDRAADPKLEKVCEICGGSREFERLEMGDGGRWYGTGESDPCPNCQSPDEVAVSAMILDHSDIEELACIFDNQSHPTGFDRRIVAAANQALDTTHEGGDDES